MLLATERINYSLGKHSYSVEAFVVVFLKFAVITMTISAWSGYNEKGYLFLYAIKY